MKSYIKILLIISTASLFGCKKFLDQQPISQVSSNIVFADVSSATNAIAGAYSQLVGDDGFGIRLSLYYTVDNDETCIAVGSSSNGDRYDIAFGGVSSASKEVYNPWSNIFQGIEYSNICISEIPKMAMYGNGTNQQKAQLRRILGEAYTLRAQFYSEAIKIWGDLPAHFQPAAVLASANPFPSRIDRDSIYDILLNDLSLASNLLPWKSELVSIGDAIDERITKAVAKGLRARIALFRGGYSLRQDKNITRGSNYQYYYQIARDECKAIMDKGENGLNKSFKDLWKNQVCAKVVSDPDNELIFQASTIGDLNAESNTKLGYYNGPKLSPSPNANAGNASIRILPTYFYKFDSNDTRRDVSCAIYSVSTDDGITKIKNSSILNIADGKYRRDWIKNLPVGPNAGQKFGLKWQILRYSDILLMFAEAENELNGPTALAYDAINQVRRRGFGVTATNYDLIGLSKEQFFEALITERSLELGGEGLRKYDLIRWNRYAVNIEQTKNWLTQLALTAPQLPAGISSYTGITLPKQMFFITGTKNDDKTIFTNSFYKPSGSAPAGTSSVRWFNVITSGAFIYDVLQIKAYLAQKFIPNRSELLPIPYVAITENPNLKQNPGYE